MPERPPSYFEAAGKKLKRAAIIAGAALAMDAGHAPKPVEAAKEPEPIEQTAVEPHPFFDTNPDFLLRFDRGRFSEEERARRTRTLPDGSKFFEDIGLTFYRVKPGDTISEIRQKLLKRPEYAYLRDQRGQLTSFNVDPKSLQADSWLPLPTENENRYVTDAQFAEYARRAVRSMRENKEYGAQVRAILERAGEDELVAAMLAIAKQESGGEPIGSYEYHRYEPAHRVYSYSAYHVLMKDDGLRARRTLGLTEGQTYHPQNGAELFLAFLCEKTNHPEKFFPLDEHLEKFAEFYNGKAWREYNPNYVDNVSRYYAEVRQAQDNVAATDSK